MRTTTTSTNLKACGARPALQSSLSPAASKPLGRRSFTFRQESLAIHCPATRTASLLQQCRLLALWYEVDNPVGPGELAKSVSSDLGASLGSADEPSQFKRTDGDWGSGYWSPYKVWERANRRIVLAVDPGGPDPAYPARTHACSSSLALRWPHVDYHSTSTGGGVPEGQPSLKDAAEGARVAHFENACSFDDGHNNWQGGQISFGEKLLRDFPDKPLEIVHPSDTWPAPTQPS